MGWNLLIWIVAPIVGVGLAVGIVAWILYVCCGQGDPNSFTGFYRELWDGLKQSWPMKKDKK